jgi:DNA helicase HerA-like ATPase
MASSTLDEWFGMRAPRLGVVTDGSLGRGLDVKLDARVEIEELAVGRYVVVHGRRSRFLCMVTDIGLASTNPRISQMPPDTQNPYLMDVYAGTTAYGTAHITPMLVINEETGSPEPVRTVPPHFADVLTATADDINRVFGEEDERHFYIGEPLELEETQVNVDLVRLTERSVGVFGKSGTGKSYLTRILLAGILARGTAVNLIFDMHNDYGWAVINEQGQQDKGLKQLFGDRVVIFTLDPESSRRRQAKLDYTVTIGYDDIDPEDLAMLKLTMDLSDTMLDAAYSLRRMWGPGWIQSLLTAPPEAIEELLLTTPINGPALTALLRRLQRFQRFGFLRPQAEGDAVQEILNYLDRGISVILEFGRYGNALEAYILVANYITRRIHSRYMHRVEESLGDEARMPKPLLITIEEAHKFLDPAIARQTIFGTIAREMRKFRVTLLIVDQRPSGIDEEVMSQVGTRVTGLLDNDRDINAVLMGISGAQGLREVLARLDTRQQAIVMGHAVPMPVVIRSRPYDEAFYKAMGEPIRGKSTRRRGGGGGRQARNDLYGDKDFEGFD